MDLSIRGARLVSGEPVDIGVMAGLIAEITPASAHPPPFLDAAITIDGEGQAVAPGLVDAHLHGWQALLRGVGPDMTLTDYLDAVVGRELSGLTPDTLHYATLVRATEAIRSGITTVFDWSHAAVDREFSDAVLEAYESVGIRAVVAYSGGDEAGARRFAELDGRVTGALTSLGPEYGSWDAAVRDIRLALDLDLLVSVHVGAGADSPLWRLRAAGLLGPHVQLVHANQITAEGAKMLADEGVHVVITPVVEATMGHGASAYGRLIDGGVRPALGTDVVVNAPADLFEPMRATLQQHRLGTGQMTPAATFLTAATEDAARAIGLAGVTGTLAVGHRADLILLDHVGHQPDPAGALVTTGRPSDVNTVIVDGQIVRQSFSDA
ncbi:amidohydrolase family protein [Actinoplanes subtropicus]|uniref:amidohydrolase family protein n=1 Tax=Actinoplanes subtropicus TaxID=543632 RepID=UPI000A06619E|nr:amidohydrolase family protein [Actinoplanes subtropicus]